MSKWVELNSDLYEENSKNSIEVVSEQGKYFLNLKIELKTVDKQSFNNDVEKRKHQDNYRELNLNTNLIGELKNGKIEITKKDLENRNGVTLKVSVNGSPKVPHTSSSPFSEKK